MLAERRENRTEKQRRVKIELKLRFDGETIANRSVAHVVGKPGAEAGLRLKKQGPRPSRESRGSVRTL